jgi:hypothetical protein
MTTGGRPSLATFTSAASRRGLPEQLTTAYTSGWTVLLVAAAVCRLVPSARWLAHTELALALHIHITPAPRPTLAAAGWLLANNLRATAWPLIPILARAHTTAWLRRLISIAVLASLAINLLPVGAAIGVYRAQLIPYLPHLPFELYAITTGPAAWAIATRHPLSRRQLALIATSMLATLVIAAVLETWAVPHR